MFSENCPVNGEYCTTRHNILSSRDTHLSLINKSRENLARREQTVRGKISAFAERHLTFYARLETILIDDCQKTVDTYEDMLRKSCSTGAANRSGHCGVLTSQNAVRSSEGSIPPSAEVRQFELQQLDNGTPT
jgi:hypothetical protein